MSACFPANPNTTPPPPTPRLLLRWEPHQPPSPPSYRSHDKGEEKRQKPKQRETAKVRYRRYQEKCGDWKWDLTGSNKIKAMAFTINLNYEESIMILLCLKWCLVIVSWAITCFKPQISHFMVFWLSIITHSVNTRSSRQLPDEICDLCFSIICVIVWIKYSVSFPVITIAHPFNTGCCVIIPVGFGCDVVFDCK